jgi:hypothetical protein
MMVSHDGGKSATPTKSPREESAGGDYVNKRMRRPRGLREGMAIGESVLASGMM